MTDDLGRPVILVVDDDASSQFVLVQVLEMEGYATATAANGIEALASIEATRPALVLLDLRLPIRTGIELVQDLHERGSWPGIPVLPMSAGIALAERYAREFGAGPVLLKPFDLDDLLRMVAAAMAPLHMAESPTSQCSRQRSS